MPGEVKHCGGCYGYRLKEFFDMGTQPLAEDFRARYGQYPLKLLRCRGCSLVQLSFIPPPEEVFAADHPYSTGNSAALREHYGRLARDLSTNLLIGDTVVDIGANDGTLLGGYPPGRGNLVKIAVEPTDQILHCRDDIVRYQEPFTAELASRIGGERGPAKVITACNVLAHVPDVHDFLDGVAILLADDGVLVTENHDLESITGGLQVDTVYHEHLRYYSVGSLSGLLEKHGLHVTRSEQVPTHGGSFRVTARVQRSGFPGRARAAATALRAMLWKITEQDRKTVYGIGAATRAVPLIHYAGIANQVTVCCEVAGSDKIGKKIPGTQIPVVDEQALIDDQPEYALLFSWHMADVIIPKLRAAGYKGKFIVPLPEPKVLDD